MKNLKKSLALVLVLVLALGMVPFVSASGPADMNVTDYSDYDSIDYKEAVDVLTALGVLQGDQGIFRPQDTITRAEAAKIIAYIRLGTATAEALPVMNNNTFADVGPDHWANRFVEYGSIQGIIAGHGDGYFRPEDPVTGIQIGKMLLMALGYGVNGEFEGPGWELAVIDRARQPSVRVLIGTGDGVDFSAPATRQEVAQYTFNTLYITRMVSWNSTINDYSFWSQTVGGRENRPTLGDSTFRLGYDSRNNMYGIQGRIWWIITTSRQLTPWYQTDAVLGVTTNGTPIDTLSNTSGSLTVRGRTGFVAELERHLGHYVAPNAGPRSDVVPIWVNGYPAGVPGSDLSRDDAYRLAATPGVIVYLLDNLTSSTTLMDYDEEFSLDIQYWYEHNGRVDRIVIIAKTAHEAGGVPIVAANGNVTITGVTPRNLRFMLNNSNNGGINRADNDLGQYYDDGNTPVPMPTSTATTLTPSIVDVRGDTVRYPEGIERGDVLLVHTANVGGVRTTIVEKADSVDGQMTNVRLAAPANITFAGETFNESGLTRTALFSGPQAGPANINGAWGTGYWSNSPDNENHLFAMTRSGINNLNVDATIWLDDNGDVLRARRVEPGDAVWGLITGYESDGVLQSGLSVRLTTSDGITDFYTVARRTGQTVTGIIDAIRSISVASGLTVNGVAIDDELVAALVAYTILDDGRVQLNFSNGTDGVGTGNTAVAGTAVPRTAIATYGSLSSPYSERRNALNVDLPNNATPATNVTQYITGTTVIFYFDTTFTDPRVNQGNGGWHATINPVTVGIGPEGSNMPLGIGTLTSFVHSPGANNTNLQAIWFNVQNSGAGAARWALLRNTGSMEHDSDGGTPVYDFDVWTLDSHASSLRVERTIDTDQGVSIHANGVGLYEYTRNNRGWATPAPAPGNFPFGRTVDLNGTTELRSQAANRDASRIYYADKGIIQYMGENDDLRYSDGSLVNPSINGTDRANRGPIRVDDNTKYFMVELNTARSSIQGGVNVYGGDYIEEDRRDAVDREQDYVGFFLLGVQRGVAEGDAAVAVYFYQANVPGTGNAINNLNTLTIDGQDDTADIFASLSGLASGTSMRATDTSFDLGGDAATNVTATFGWSTSPTSINGKLSGSPAWQEDEEIIGTLTLTANPGNYFPSNAATTVSAAAPTFPGVGGPVVTLRDNKTIEIVWTIVVGPEP